MKSKASDVQHKKMTKIAFEYHVEDPELTNYARMHEGKIAIV